LQVDIFINASDSKLDNEHNGIISQKKLQNSEFLKWLLPSYWLVESQLCVLRYQRYTGTLQWAHNMDEFRHWRTSAFGSEESFLWIRGPPGVGKSTMAAYFVDLLRFLYPDSIIAYFFFKTGHSGLTTASDVIRTLAYQTIRDNQDARQTLDELKNEEFNLEQNIGVRYLFDQLLLKPMRQTQKNIFIILDGVDEADIGKVDTVDGRRRSEIEVLIESLHSIPLARLLFTSRPQADLSRFVTLLTIRDVHNTENRGDIDVYVQNTIKGSEQLLTQFNNAGIDPINFFRAANGSYIWVNLVLKDLARTKSKLTFRRSLEKFSEESGDLRLHYTEILKKFDGEDRKWVREILKWVIAANRELDVRELQEAVEWSLQDELSQFRRFLEVECGSIVMISTGTHGEGFVRFLHNTFRSFLTNPKICPLEFYVDEGTMHFYILSICVSVLSCPTKMSFLAQYAATQWVAHLVNATASRSEKHFLDILAYLFHIFQSDGCKNWIKLALLDVGVHRVQELELDVHIDEHFVRDIYGALVSCKESAELANYTTRFRYRGHTALTTITWGLDILGSPWKLEDLLARASAELWLYHDLDIFQLHTAFCLTLKYYCKRQGRVTDSLQDLQDIAAGQFSSILHWVDAQPMKVRPKNIGVAYIALRQWEGAISCFTTPLDIEEWLYLGLASLKSGKHDDAIEAFQRVTEMNPKARWPWICLSHANQAKGDPNGAIASLEKALSVDPDSRWAFLYLGEAYAAKNDKSAVINCYERAVAKDPTEWWAWQYLYDAYVANGDITGAIMACKRAVEQNPSQEWALSSLRNALIQQNKTCISVAPDLLMACEEPQAIGLSFAEVISGRVPHFMSRATHLSAAQFKQHERDWFAICNINASSQFRVSLVHTFGHSSWVASVAFSSTGQHIATGCYRSVQIFDVSSGEKVGAFLDENIATSADYIRSICFSPDGRYLGMSVGDAVSIWEISKRSVIKQLLGHTSCVQALGFSQDCGRLSALSRDGTIKIWDIDKGAEIRQLPTHGGAHSAAISLEDRIGITSESCGEMRAWDTETGGQLGRLEGHTEAAYSVSFSPTGHELLSISPSDMKLWEVKTLTGRAAHDLTENPAAIVCKNTISQKKLVMAVAWSPDGKSVLLGDMEGRIQSWDLVDGQPQFLLQGHNSSGFYFGLYF
jgi:tetratricopeptide (TPR) repeat protein